MTAIRPLHKLFAITGGAPTLLVPNLASNEAGRAHDELPLGVYEALRTFDHDRFVGLTEHVDRLERSIGLAGLEGTLDRGALLRGLDAIAREFDADDAKVRFDFLAGPALALGSDSRVVVQATELRLPPPAVYQDGVSVQITKLRRARPAVKEARWVVERRATEDGSPDNFESILVDAEGRLLEGTMSNFFWVRRGVLCTAPVSGVLPGVTRGFVLALAAEAGIETREQAAQIETLDELDEAFLTTSVRSVVPVVRIAGTTLGGGRPGPVTRALIESYSRFCERSAAQAFGG